MKPVPPCYQCEARRPGCHNPEACALWADFEAAKRAFETAKQPVWDEHEITASYIRQKQTRIQHRERYSRNRK